MRFVHVFLVSLLFPALLVAEADSVSSLERELSVLEAELDTMLNDEVALEVRESYVTKVLDLRDRIEALSLSESAGSGERVYTLVEVEGHTYPGEDYRFDQNSMTFSYFRNSPETSGAYARSEKTSVSMGLEEYPKTIVLGKDFSFVASMRSQREVGGYLCATTSKNHYSFVEEQEIKVGAKQISVTKKHAFIRPGCEKLRSNGRVNSSQPFGVGHQLRVGMECRFTEAEKSVYLEYKYECEPSSIDGEIEDNFYYNSQKAIELSWNVKKGQDGEWITQSDFANRHELRVTLGGGTLPKNAITLLYQADYRDDLKQQDGGTVAHTVAVNNTWQNAAQTQTQLADAGEGEQGESDTLPAGMNTDSSDTGPSGSSVSSSDGSDLLPTASLDDTNRWVTYWLENAEPVENATTGYDLRFDEWGRVQGKAPNGTIALGSAPDAAAGMSPVSFALSRATTLDSLNLCTLAEFINRKAKGQSTEDCVKPPAGAGAAGSNTQSAISPGILPDFVGVSAATAKADLTRLQLEGSWKAGTAAPSQNLAGTIEKQEPAAGSKFESGANVTLWVYRAPPNSAGKKVLTVPDVEGLPVSEAEQKIRTAGFEPKKGKVVPAYERQLAGTVEMQYPKAGFQSANSVDVLYNMYGELQVAVPYLHGKSKVEALKILSEAGLRGSVKTGMTTAYGFGDNVGTVYEIKPPSGTRVADNSLVHLVVWGKMAPAPKLKSKPSPKPKPRYIPPPPPRVSPETNQALAKVNPNIPGRFNCETGLTFMPQDVKKNWLSSSAGQGGIDWTFKKRGLAHYSCQHTVRTRSGSTKSRSVNVYWYVRKPQRGSTYYSQFKRYCAEARRDGYGNGRSVNIFMNAEGGIKNFIGEQNAQHVFNFHARQVAPYAVPCDTASTSQAIAKPPRVVKPPAPQPRRAQTASTYVNPNIPGRFSCETGLKLMPQNLEKSWSTGRAGQGGLKPDPAYGRVGYSCQHTVYMNGRKKKAKVDVHWNVKKQRQGDKGYQVYKRTCNTGRRDGYFNGKAIAISMNVDGGIVKFLGKQNAQHVFNFHLRQVSQYAVSCD